MKKKLLENSKQVNRTCYLNSWSYITQILAAKRRGGGVLHEWSGRVEPHLTSPRRPATASEPKKGSLSQISCLSHWKLVRGVWGVLVYIGCLEKEKVLCYWLKKSTLQPICTVRAGCHGVPAGVGVDRNLPWDLQVLTPWGLFLHPPHTVIQLLIVQEKLTRSTSGEPIVYWEGTKTKHGFYKRQHQSYWFCTCSRNHMDVHMHTQWKNGGWIALSCHYVNKMATRKPVTQSHMFLLGISQHRTLHQPHTVL